MTTGFIFDDNFLLHNPGYGHPECPERLQKSMAYLKQQAWFNSLKHLPVTKPELTWLSEIHSDDYIKRVNLACSQNLPYLDTMDVGICRDSFHVALLAVGAALSLADQVALKRIKNGFGMIRPPGHHAETDMALGFCLFNNVAILARYLRKKYGINKVLILDWDVHHGNGTQHSFEEDPSVLYISTHQYPFYPGTGAYSETGTGKGKGATLNCPMPVGSSDKDYESVFVEKIIPKMELFKPEFIIISAGFDAHRDDQIAGINLSTEFFGWMTDRIMEIADKHSDGRIISLLEGGYNLDVLPLCIELHLLHLSGAVTSNK